MDFCDRNSILIFELFMKYLWNFCNIFVSNSLSSAHQKNNFRSPSSLREYREKKFGLCFNHEIEGDIFFGLHF